EAGGDGERDEELNELADVCAETEADNPEPGLAGRGGHGLGHKESRQEGDDAARGNRPAGHFASLSPTTVEPGSQRARKETDETVEARRHPILDPRIAIARFGRFDARQFERVVDHAEKNA